LKIPRLIIGGTTSGVGKTSISCAIIHGMKKRGYSVQPFKVGPDGKIGFVIFLVGLLAKCLGWEKMV